MKDSTEFRRSPSAGSKAAAAVFTLIILAVALIGIEVVLRTTNLFGARISFSEPNDALGYRYTPNSTYWCYKENDHPISGKINKFGYRDKDWSVEKPEHTYRVAVLGDSYVAALEVEEDSTFMAIAQAELIAVRDENFEIMNFGRPGYTQSEELLILESDVMRFCPDMVVVFFYPGNDVCDVRKATSPGAMRPFFSIGEDGDLLLDTSFTETGEFRMKQLMNMLKQRSALISLMAERLNLYLTQRRMAKAGLRPAGSVGERPTEIPPVFTLCTANPEPRLAESYEFNKVLIGHMAALCAQRNTPFMLVTIDIKAYLPEFEEAYREIDPTFDAYYFEDDMREFADSLDIEYLGLQRIFRDAHLRIGEPLHWGHWNYRGHAVVAGALAECLDAAVDRQEIGVQDG
jgi:hypothetical protein